MTKPIIGGFSEIVPLIIQSYERYLPTAFDDSMTMLQKVNKIIEYLNEVGKISNEVVTQWNSVMEWVSGEGLETKIDETLSLWKDNGELETIINNGIFKEKFDSNEIISVIRNGIKNDGTPIGTELNTLINQSYGKTLYFPDGVYNLTESMVTPWEYSKNVHLTFSPNAIIKCDVQLPALLRIGFSNVNEAFDRTQRRFNYITGGQFDCSKADIGIEVNGLKQLVFLKDINLYKGKTHHIKIRVSSEFVGTGSSDTKIQNVHIQGLSSNENSYGIYIDEQCYDCKMDHVFIYGCKIPIYTKSAGHFFNDIHVLSQVTTGGNATGNFAGTIGLQIETNGQFFLNQFYFDTVETAIYTKTFSPKLSLVNCYYYSYVADFGNSFIKRDFSTSSTLELYMNGCSISINKQDYKIIDANVPIGFDPFNRLQIKDLTISGREKIYKYDPYLSQKVRGVKDDYLIQTNNKNFDTSWVVLGVLPASTGEIEFVVSYSINRSVKLFFENNLSGLTYEVRDPNTAFFFEIGKATVQIDGLNYTILLFRPLGASTGFPILTTIRGMASFMRTPSDTKKYTLTDYNLTSEMVSVVVNKS